MRSRAVLKPLGRIAYNIIMNVGPLFGPHVDRIVLLQFIFIFIGSLIIPLPLYILITIFFKQLSRIYVDILTLLCFRHELASLIVLVVV
jgi:hypothetical protein